VGAHGDPKGVTVSSARTKSETSSNFQQELGTLSSSASPSTLASFPLCVNGLDICKSRKIFTAKELGFLLGKHIATVYRWFDNVQGVIRTQNKVKRPNTRAYRSLLVPEKVLIKVMSERDIRIPSTNRI